MSISNSKVNATGSQAGQAPLKNVVLFMTMVTELINRDTHLPGLGVMYSPSGYGKTMASTYAQIKTGAIRVEAAESWDRKSLTEGILNELGVYKPQGSVARQTAQVIQLLGDNPRRPLIIDEADKLFRLHMLELVREIHEHSQVPVILIGEELLPKKLERFERVHNRVLRWLPALPCDLADGRKLADFYAPDLTISDAMLARIVREGGSRARRISTTLSEMRKWAGNSGSNVVPDDWDGQIFTGQPPQRQKGI